MKIKISADSTCDLSPELIARYNIGITPLYIVRGDETLRDGIDVRPEELYAYAKATGKLCQTAAVNVSDYYAYFSAARAEYDAVIHFTISSDMSGCYQNACIAAREFTNVYPVDARNLSTGIGHLVLDAAEMAAQGMDAADIAAALDVRADELLYDAPASGKAIGAQQIADVLSRCTPAQTQVLADILTAAKQGMDKHLG